MFSNGLKVKELTRHSPTLTHIIDQKIRVLIFDRLRFDGRYVQTQIVANYDTKNERYFCIKSYGSLLGVISDDRNRLFFGIFSLINC